MAVASLTICKIADMPTLSYANISSRLTPSIFGRRYNGIAPAPLCGGALPEESNVKILNAKTARQIQITGKNS